jgi:hypothetical protein
MILKKPIIIIIALSLVATLLLAVPQTVLAVPGQCPANTTLIAKFEWDDIEGWVLGEGADPNPVTVRGDAQSGTWESTVWVIYVDITDGHDPASGEPISGYVNYYPYPIMSGEYDASLMEPDVGHDISNLVFCGPVWPVTLASFTAMTSRGVVNIDWVTATEIDTAGFMLYRSTSPDGPRVQVNASLLGAKGDGVTGASYRFTDSPGYGGFYYWLEDVDYSGMSSLHGPAYVHMLPAIRRPIYRPSLPGK